MDTAIPVCPHCGNSVFPTDEFCSHCGFRLFGSKMPSIWKQSWIFAVSFFLPPLGLIWVVKYIKSSEKIEKRIALIALFLTVLSLIISVWVGFGIIGSITQQVSQYKGVSSVGL